MREFVFLVISVLLCHFLVSYMMKICNIQVRTVILRALNEVAFVIPQPLDIDNVLIPSAPSSGSSRSSKEIPKGNENTPYEYDPTNAKTEHDAKTSNFEKKCAIIAKNIIKSTPMFYGYRDKNIANVDTGRYMEFDIFFPNVRFAIECQGPHHYDPTSTQMARDNNKANLALANGICLVTIPYTLSDEIIRKTIIEAAKIHGIVER